MVLSAKTLYKFTRGAASFTDKGGVFRPFRFTSEQIEYILSDKFDRGWADWAMQTGAIRLEFKTDATKISFDYVASSNIKESNTVDFIVDGALSAVYRVDDSSSGHIEHNMGEGLKKIIICLPCITNFGIKKFTLNGTYKSIKAPKTRVLILGDSITHGGGPLMSSATYVNMLAMKTGYEILGQGIAGYRYEPRETMMVADGFNPHMVVVFLGTNYYEASHLENGYDYKRAVYEYHDKLVSLYPDLPFCASLPFGATTMLIGSASAGALTQLRAPWQDTVKSRSSTALASFPTQTSFLRTEFIPQPTAPFSSPMPLKRRSRPYGKYIKQKEQIGQSRFVLF